MNKLNNLIKNNFFIFTKAIICEPLYFFILILVTLMRALRATFISVYIIKYVIQKFEIGADIGITIRFLLISLLILAVCFILDLVFSEVYAKIKRERLSNFFQQQIFTKIKNIDYIKYDNKEIYNQIILSSKECDERIFAVIDNFFAIIQCLITVISVISVTASIDYLVIIICVTLSFLVAYYFNLKINKYVVDYKNKMDIREKEDIFIRRIVKLPEHSIDYRITNIDKLLNKVIRNNSFKKLKIVNDEGKMIFKYGWMNTLFSEAFLMDLVIPTYLVIQILFLKDIPLSSFVALVNASYKIKYELDNFIEQGAEFYRNGLYIERIIKLLKIKNNIEDDNNSENRISSFQSLELKNVSFHYADSSFKLNNINMIINKGEKIALVGKNGSGKSTLINILLKLYEPNDGQLLLNGVYDINKIKTSAYRSNYGLLLQDFQYYATVFGKNVSMDKNYDIKKINSTINYIEFQNVMKKLPKGFETNITNEFHDDGLMFSGGELQKMALCRSFYDEKDIYVFDEPTSALDIRQEEIFYQLIEKKSSEKTIIFTSHRLSSVKLCDRIYFFNNGKIAEYGSHKELLELNGLYADMYHTQEKMYAN